MTNKEHFKEEIFEVACSGTHIAVDKKTNKPYSCKDISCDDCAFRKGDMKCKDAFLKWLEEEYVEPCPFEKGELVEVSDDREFWYLEYFDEFTRGRYITRESKMSECTSAWKYCQKYGTLGGLVKGEKEND